MLKTEMLKFYYSSKVRKCDSYSGKTALHSRQKGSILVGIIITMVVMATLGAGMVYLTTTSTYNELFANNHARAYYVAESGGRYAGGLAMQALATGNPAIDTLTATYFANPYTMGGNGDKFQITNWVKDASSGSMNITFDSTGTVGSGFLQAKRKISYRINPANQLGAGPPPPPPDPPPIDLTTMTGKLLTGSMEFALATPGGDQALVVAKDQGGAEAEAYVFVPPPAPNPFWVNWGDSGGYSSYDLQVKLATGTLSGTTLINPPLTYANGLTFRAINQGGQKQDFLGVSLVRNGMLLPPDATVTPPAVYTTWAKATVYAKDVYVINAGAYYQCITAHTSSSKFSTDAAKWLPLSNADTPMIVLWRRDSNQANGDGSWLAYKILDEKSFIVDASEHTIDWSTLLVRVVEAASVKLQVAPAPLINTGDTIAGATGTARVIRKINETSANGGNVVLLLNNIGGTFTRPTTINGYATDATWGYRSRDNYIWVFYTDQNTVTPVRSSTNTTPMETDGVNNVRLGQLRSTTACGPINCPINWPITDVQVWTAADDKFSLVNWNSHLNTTLFSTEYPTQTIRIMGSLNEAEAIIRTDLYTRPGPYAVSGDFPGEIGLVSLGGENDAFFDDLAYRLTGGSGSGGGYIDGTGLFIQGP